VGKLLNVFFKLDIDLMQLYRLFDELVSENKALDKPKQLLEMMLQDLQADRKSIFYEYEPSVEIKAIYRGNMLWITPKFLKDFLGIEEKTIRTAWLRRGYTQKFEHRGKEVDYKSITHKKIPFRAISLNNSIITELGFDFSERKR